MTPIATALGMVACLLFSGQIDSGDPCRNVQAAEFAVVVSDASPVDDLTIEQLRRIFMGDRRYWSDGTRVHLLIQAPGTRERDAVLDMVYRMSEPQYKQFWITKIFRTQATSGPKVMQDDATMMALLAAVPGTLAIVPVGDLPPDIKVVLVGGLLPGAEDYPLHR